MPIQAASAEEAIFKVIHEKKISNKINYDVLNDLKCQSGIQPPTPLQVPSTPLQALDTLETNGFELIILFNFVLSSLNTKDWWNNVFGQLTYLDHNSLSSEGFLSAESDFNTSTKREKKKHYHASWQQEWFPNFLGGGGLTRYFKSFQDPFCKLQLGSSTEVKKNRKICLLSFSLLWNNESEQIWQRKKSLQLYMSSISFDFAAFHHYF